MKGPQVVETIVFVDEQDECRLTKVSSIRRRPDIGDPAVHNREESQILVSLAFT